MSVPRYEREIDEIAGPRFTRVFLIAVVTAILLGVGIGVVWVITGVLHFHPFW
jgi:hypothetical protein